MSFLKAEWRKLVLANYEVPSSLLEKHLPAGTELDLWNGKCYVSLVGFMFLNTKLLGVKVPGHVTFEEVNLRFYVKRHVNGAWRRGVVFIKEIVPKPALTLVANTIYSENYETLPMKHLWEQNDVQRSVSYEWRKNGQWNWVSVTAQIEPSEIIPGSEAEFIMEHYWGYARINPSTTNEYEVKHPTWLQYNILDYDTSVNFKETYGSEFEFLNQTEPTSVMLAEGSEISVEHKKKVRII